MSQRSQTGKTFCSVYFADYKPGLDLAYHELIIAPANGYHHRAMAFRADGPKTIATLEPIPAKSES